MERRVLEDAGFDQAQIDALMECFTVHHHHHDIDEVDGLQEELEELCEGEEDEDDG